jgi:hypothetical protein
MSDLFALALTPVLIFALIVAGQSYKEYTKSECLKAYATSTKTVDEINKVCK